MFINNFDPVAFQVFSFEIRWYSLAYIVGLVVGWIYCNKFLIKDQEKKNQFDDYIAYIIIGIIVGGRLGYVIIYNPSYYLENIIEIPMIWNGGMSFHGAVIGVIISTIFFCKKNNQNIFYYLDLVALSSPIGIFLGRISNFINSELFIILNFFYKKYSEKNGLISSLFVIFYSVFRFIIEFTREPDTHIGLILFGLSMGQIISGIFFIAGTILFYKSYVSEKR
jgi:phosphatidylglycerol:prolipoprotein diacylglycerol transferase